MVRCMEASGHFDGREAGDSQHALLQCLLAVVLCRLSFAAGNTMRWNSPQNHEVEPTRLTGHFVHHNVHLLSLAEVA